MATVVRSPTNSKDSPSSNSNLRPTTPSRASASVTGIPRYFKPTESHTILVEEKARLRAEVASEKSPPPPSRPTTPSRRSSDASNSFSESGSSHRESKLKTPDSARSRATTPKRIITDDSTTPESASRSRATTPGRKSVSSGSPNSPMEDTFKLDHSRLHKPTMSRLYQMKELEESKGQVRPEDDPWWSQRRGKGAAAELIQDSVKKQLSHVTSKLHSSTLSRTLQTREKAIIEKPGAGLTPVPKLSSPDAINPHKDVPSRLMKPTTAARAAEWKPKEVKKSPNVGKKIREVPSRLLIAPAHTQTTKFHKDLDPCDVGHGWVKILPAGSGTKALTAPFENIKPLPGPHGIRYSEFGVQEEYGYDEDGNEYVREIVEEGHDRRQSAPAGDSRGRSTTPHRSTTPRARSASRGKGSSILDNLSTATTTSASTTAATAAAAVSPLPPAPVAVSTSDRDRTSPPVVPPVPPPV